jgi:pilus assembly protein CpaB
MEKKNKRIITISLILSLATATLIYVYISGSKTVVMPEVEQATIYVAARTITARTEIIASDIKQINVAKELINAGAITDSKEIIGKYTIQSIVEGELIRGERLAGEESTYVSYMVPEGTRAVSMDVTEQINVANLVRPGDFVDLFVSFEREEAASGDVYPRTSKLLLQNIQVLALGQDVMLSSKKLSEPPTTVTLAIKAEDVERFVFATEFGVMRLALRPLGDEEEISAKGILRSDMTGNRGVHIMPDKDGG